jgi:hypothetical protein
MQILYQRNKNKQLLSRFGLLLTFYSGFCSYTFFHMENYINRLSDYLRLSDLSGEEDDPDEGLSDPLLFDELPAFEPELTDPDEDEFPEKLRGFPDEFECVAVEKDSLPDPRLN